MAQFPTLTFTEAGLQMLIQAQNGHTLKFTKGKLGSGVLTDSDNIVKFTDLKTPKMTLPITKVDDSNKELLVLTFDTGNTSLEEGFISRELGVFAQLDNGTETLYAYSNAGNNYDYMPNKDTPVSQSRLEVEIICSTSANVQIVIDKSIMYTTREDVDEMIATHDASDTAHEPAFTAKFKAHNADTDAHKDFVGATAEKAGVRGMVPAPAAGDEGKFLCADGTFKVAKMTTLELVNLLYPVGIIAEFTNNTDPNNIWPGTTWSKMDAGRVLISAGTYTEGSDTYTYTLGDKGGEAKHQLTIEELVSHGHGISISSVGNHSHDIGSTNDIFVSNIANSFCDSNTPPTRYGKTTNAGAHSLSASIERTGGNFKHENRMPYETVIRWKRTD